MLRFSGEHCLCRYMNRGVADKKLLGRQEIAWGPELDEDLWFTLVHIKDIWQLWIL